MQKNNFMMAFAVFALVVVLTIGTIFYQNNSKAADVTEDSKQPDTTTSAENQSQITSYKDGTYTSEGSYLTPDNQEKIGVTITLKDNIITGTEVEGKGVLPTSQRYQALFISGFKPLVVGKNINEVSLTRVSGSSLTPNGFNDALSKIKGQAKA